MRDYTNITSETVDCLQDNLRIIRKLLKMDCKQFADLLGCTRQCINNYELKKLAMPKHMCIAILAIVDSMPIEDNIKQTINLLLEQKIITIVDNLPVEDNIKQVINLLLEKEPS